MCTINESLLDNPLSTRQPLDLWKHTGEEWQTIQEGWTSGEGHADVGSNEDTLGAAPVPHPLTADFSAPRLKTEHFL